MGCAVIFGGTGFIGSFFAVHLLASNKFQKLYLVDLDGLDAKPAYRKNLLAVHDQIEVVIADVRNPLDTFEPPEPIELVVNFAAVHREPGHEADEYYETNILGAENVCAWSEKVGCNNLVFSSSISPYGPSESERDESSLTVPTTPYGGSKLVAEKIHQVWQAKDREHRQLTIIRPGVVFGPGEGGNVSRLIKATIHRYFFYMGNQKTRKSGVYVKELCAALYWVITMQKESKQETVLFNMSMAPGPSIEEYVEAIKAVAGVNRWVPRVPHKLLLISAYLIDALAKPLGIKHPFSPVRIQKLVRSNNIRPTYLIEAGYEYRYTLEEALFDWRRDCPEEWS